MSETTIPDLIFELKPLFSKNGRRGANYQALADRLSQIAGKIPPWSGRYLQSVESGSYPASRRLARALEILGAEIDGRPLEIADSEEVTIYARTGKIKPGSMIDGASQVCAFKFCSIWFIRTHPRQIYCPVHKERKNRK